MPLCNIYIRNIKKTKKKKVLFAILWEIYSLRLSSLVDKIKALNSNGL